MKIRQIPLVLFTSVSISIYAQIPDTVKLSVPLTGTQDKVAGKAVFMMPGFSYSATTGNTFTARINSPVNTEITPVVYLTGSAVTDTDTRQLNTDLPVG